MSKKLITGLLALVALTAFALPATASATSPELKDGSGTLVAVGTTVKATNVGNTVFKGSWGEVVCSSATLHGKVTKNSANGEAIEGTIETASFTGTSGSGTQCSGGSLGAVTVTTNIGNGVPWCMRALAGAAHELQIRGNSCANAARSITYVLHFSSFSCAYERTTLSGPVKGTYTTGDAEGAIATSTNSEFKKENGHYSK